MMFVDHYMSTCFIAATMKTQSLLVLRNKFKFLIRKKSKNKINGKHLLQCNVIYFHLIIRRTLAFFFLSSLSDHFLLILTFPDRHAASRLIDWFSSALMIDRMFSFQPLWLMDMSFFIIANNERKFHLSAPSKKGGILGRTRTNLKLSVLRCIWTVGKPFNLRGSSFQPYWKVHGAVHLAAMPRLANKMTAHSFSHPPLKKWVLFKSGWNVDHVFCSSP